MERRCRSAGVKTRWECGYCHRQVPPDILQAASRGATKIVALVAVLALVIFAGVAAAIVWLTVSVEPEPYEQRVEQSAVSPRLPPAATAQLPAEVQEMVAWSQGARVMWDAVSNGPFLSDVDGDGVEDIIGRIRISSQNDALHIAAFSGKTFEPLWRSEVLGSYSQAYRSTHLAIAKGFALVTTFRAQAMVLDLKTGKKVGTVFLSDRARFVCGAPSEAVVWAELVDKKHVLVQLDSKTSKPMERPDWCGAGRDCPPERTARCIPKRDGPKVSGARIRHLLAPVGVSKRAVAIGTKHPGTRTAIAVGFSSADRAIAWQTPLPGVDPMEAKEGLPELVDVSEKHFAAVYRTGDGAIRVVCRSTESGAKLWDVPAPAGRLPGMAKMPPRRLVVTEQRVYLVRNTALVILNAQNGAQLGLIGL